MFTALVTIALLAPSAFATLAFTQPVATSSWAPGQSVNIVWQEDNTTPKLADLGTGSFGIFVGGTTTQAEVQHIASGVNVDTTGQITFQIPDGFGPSYSGYFVRFTSDTCKDTSNALNFPCEAFSAKFTINNLNGSFNSTIQQIADNGSSSSQSAAASAPAATSGAASTGASATTSAGSSASSHASSSGSAHSSSASAKATGASSANSAAGVFASTGVVAVAAAFVGSMML